MKKLCSHPSCKTVIPRSQGSRCAVHTTPPKQKRVLSHHYIEGKYIYHMPQWRKIRKFKITETPYCQMCAGNKRVTPADMVDHIIPIEHNGKPFDLDNLQSLCNRCHRIKTAADKRLYK